MSGRMTLRALAVGVALACLPTATGALNADDAGPDGDWAFDLAIYSWITDITGEAAVGGTTVDVEPQLWNDVIRNLDIALFGGFEARYRSRWIFSTDLAFARISDENESGPFALEFGPATIQRSLQPVRGTIGGGTSIGDVEIPIELDPGTLRIDIPRVATQIGPIDVESRLTQFIVRGLVGYRAVDAPLPAALGGRGAKDDPRRIRFDVLAGLRYYLIETEIDVEIPPVELPSFRVTSSVSGGSVSVGGDRLPGRTRPLGRIDLGSASFSGATLGGTDLSAEEDVWWIDPVIGARLGVDVCDAWSLALMGNIGGFGIGSASDFSWETTVFARYLFGEHWSFAAGYRALGFDREGGGLELDLILHGPVLGFIYRF